MTKIYYGSDEVPRGWGRYYAMCNALELDLTTLENRPRTETLNRWRVESPKGFAFVLHADPDVVEGLAALSQADRTELDDRVRQGWERTMAAAHALAAKAVLIRTPMSFSPSAASRELMRKLATELAAEARPLVIWETEGMWSVEDTRDLAESLGLVYALDPFLARRDDIEFTRGDACFVITERGGMRRDFDPYDIEELLDAASRYDRIFVLLRGRFKWPHARIFRDLLKEED